MEQGLLQTLLANPQVQKHVSSEEELRAVGDISVIQIVAVSKDESARRLGVGGFLLIELHRANLRKGIRIGIGTCTAKASQRMMMKHEIMPLRTLDYSELTLRDGTPIKCHDGTDKAVLVLSHLTLGKTKLGKANL